MEQSIYELRPLLKAFMDAGTEWECNAALNAELERQGLRVMESDEKYIDLADVKTGYEVASVFTEDGTGFKVILAYYGVDEETECGLRYSFNSNGQDALRIDGYQNLEEALLSYYDALEYAQKLLTALESIRLVQSKSFPAIESKS